MKTQKKHPAIVTMPDYRQIYTDILDKKYPHKKEECMPFLQKNTLSVIDILHLNEKIFESSDKTNHKYRTYKKSDIIKILNYQKKNKLSNSELANHFKLSRNSVAKWKKLFV